MALKRAQVNGKLVVREDDVSDRLKEVERRKSAVLARRDQARESAKKQKQRSSKKKKSKLMSF